MFPRFEVRIWEAEEEPRELPPGEEVREEFHGVGADAGGVLVGVWTGVWGRGCGWGWRCGGGTRGVLRA